MNDRNIRRMKNFRKTRLTKPRIFNKDVAHARSRRGNRSSRRVFGIFEVQPMMTVRSEFGAVLFSADGVAAIADVSDERDRLTGGAFLQDEDDGFEDEDEDDDFDDDDEDDLDDLDDDFEDDDDFDDDDDDFDDDEDDEEDDDLDDDDDDDDDDF